MPAITIARSATEEQKKDIKENLEILQENILHTKTIFKMGKNIQKIVQESSDQQFIESNYGLFLGRVMFSFQTEIVLALTNLFSNEGSIFRKIHKPLLSSNLEPFDKNELMKNAEEFYLSNESTKKIYDKQSLTYLIHKTNNTKTDEEIKKIRIEKLKKANLPVNKYEALDFKKQELLSLFKDIEFKITKSAQDGGLPVMKLNGEDVSLNTFRNKFLAHHDKEFYRISRWANIYFVFVNSGTAELLEKVRVYLDKYYYLLFGATYTFDDLITRNNKDNIDLKFLKEKFEQDLNAHQGWLNSLKSRNI